MSFNPQNAYITPASPVVVDQITRLNENADHMVQQVNAALSQILSLSFSNVDIDPRFQFNEEDLQSLLNQLGDIPNYDTNTDWLRGLSLSAGDEDFRFNPEIFQYLRQTLPDFNIDPLGALPPEPAAPPDPGEPTEIAAPSRPTLPDYTAPDVDLDQEPPEYEDFTSEIPFPILRPINLPTPPTLNLDAIEFEGVRPVFDATPPDANDFVFENGVYDPILINEAKAKILEMFNGQSGLPASVEDALFERAREREIELGERDVESVRDADAARGHKYPSGPLQARVYRVRRDASNKVSQLNRDQFIEHWRIQIEQLRQALSSAVALEDVWSRVFLAGESNRLQAVQIKLSLAMQVFNAYVTRFNAQISLYEADARVFVERFNAEQIKVQAYAEQLRAQQLIGELNEQDVRIFAERVRALQVNADIYRAKVEGYKALFDAIDSKVNVYRSQLESNRVLADIYEGDVRAFGEQIRAQASRDERFRIKADIYGRNTEAWARKVDTLYKNQESQIEVAKLTRDSFVANTDRVRAFVDGEARRISALTDKYQALAAEVGAKSEAERSRFTLMLSVAQAKIARMQAAAEILLKNGEINIQAGLSAENLMLRARETAATLLAQLAAGFTSAANVNASISDSSSSSISYSFSGELDT